MTKQALINNVTTELKTLLSLSSIEEIERLKIKHFNPFTRFTCIYGLLTGDCESKRAKSLIDVCSRREIVMPNSELTHPPSLKFLEYSSSYYPVKMYSGATWLEPRKNENTINRSYIYLSPLEFYIRIKGAEIGNIMSFLKQRTERLSIDNTY